MQPSFAPRDRGSFALLSALLFTSGATALAAQVSLNRLLGYVFGASHMATATVLAAYMGGLSLGAFCFGRLSRRWRRPLVVYGVLELLVAALFALVPTVFPHFQSLGIDLVRPVQEHPLLLTLVRLALSFSFVLAPTVLMGATLPTLLARFDAEAALKRRLPLLYALNTLGGAAGALLSGYLSIPTFGLDRTLWLCALLNAVVGATAVAWGRLLDVSREAAPAVAAPDGAHAGLDLDGRLLAWLAFGQGLLAFVLEVTWSHLIRTAIGVTAYAFTVMLACILLGIGIGSLLVPSLLRRAGQGGAVRVFATAQVALALALAGSLYVWDTFPLVISRTLRWRYEWSFVEREVVRFAFALALLLPATLALGVALPALTAAVRTARLQAGGVGRWVGQVLAANTLGGILGSLLCGFWLLGNVPSSAILGGAAFLSLGLALIASRGASSWRWWRAPRLLVPVAACSAAIALFPGWNRARLTSGNHLLWDFYPGDELNDSLLLLREDATAGFITVERGAGGAKVLRANGKYEGSDQPVEFQDQFALLGALYLKRFERAAIVGLGPGRTLRVLVDMPFRRIDVAELSPGIADVAITHFSRFMQASLQDRDRVRLHLDDGRNRLQLAEPGYDYVGVGISGAAVAGVGGLYTRDFFEVVRSRLDRNGVFLLWLQVHHVPPPDVRSVVFTLASVFPHVHFYATPRGDQGFLIASQAPLTIDPAGAERIGSSPYIRSLLESGGRRSLLDLVAWNVFSTPEEIQAFLRSTSDAAQPVMFTDFWPGFEYRASRGLATQLLFFDFSPWSAATLPQFEPPLAPGENAGLRGLRLRVAGRNQEALAAFEESQRLLGKPVWSEEILALRRTIDAGQEAGQSRRSSS
jgi:spermidine synthase